MTLRALHKSARSARRLWSIVKKVTTTKKVAGIEIQDMRLWFVMDCRGSLWFLYCSQVSLAPRAKYDAFGRVLANESSRRASLAVAPAVVQQPSLYEPELRQVLGRCAINGRLFPEAEMCHTTVRQAMADFVVQTGCAPSHQRFVEVQNRISALQLPREEAALEALLATTIPAAIRRSFPQIDVFNFERLLEDAMFLGTKLPVCAAEYARLVRLQNSMVPLLYPRKAGTDPSRVSCLGSEAFEPRLSNQNKPPIKRCASTVDKAVLHIPRPSSAPWHAYDASVRLGDAMPPLHHPSPPPRPIVNLDSSRRKAESLHVTGPQEAKHARVAHHEIIRNGSLWRPPWGSFMATMPQGGTAFRSTALTASVPRPAHSPRDQHQTKQKGRQVSFGRRSKSSLDNFTANSSRHVSGQRVVNERKDGDERAENTQETGTNPHVYKDLSAAVDWRTFDILRRAIRMGTPAQDLRAIEDEARSKVFI